MKQVRVISTSGLFTFKADSWRYQSNRLEVVKNADPDRQPTDGGILLPPPPDEVVAVFTQAFVIGVFFVDEQS